MIKNRKVRFNAFVALLVFFSLLLILISFSLGFYQLPFKDIVKVLFGDSSIKEQYVVLFNIRLPRILSAFIIGAALSVSGSAYQGMFKNPLVSPDILGVSAGAGLGAAIAISMGLAYYWVQIFAFVMGLIVVFFAYTISLKVKYDQSLSLVLSGTMFGTLAVSGTTMLKYLADPSDTLPAITFWLMGSLSKITMDNLMLALPPIIIGFVIIFMLRWRLNILTLGDEEAQSIGINPKRARLYAIVGATFLSAASVCLGGLIGWVGLMIPHIARSIVGPQYKKMLPVSALLGGCFLLLMDDIARSLLVMEIPIGVMTAFAGAPFFIFLILSDKGR